MSECVAGKGKEILERGGEKEKKERGKGGKELECDDDDDGGGDQVWRCIICRDFVE